MGNHLAAIVEADIGQETLVTAKQDTAGQAKLVMHRKLFSGPRGMLPFAAMTQRPVTAAVLIIGNEILSGRTQDANLAHLAKTLNHWGLRLREARIVADVEAEIVAAVNALRSGYDYLFTTGGIGPTHDDITAASITTAFGLPLIEHPEALALLEAYYPPGELNAARRRMARVPQGAGLIDNPISKAPGFAIGNVLVLAGVPAIMRAQLDNARSLVTGGAPMLSHTVSVLVGEGRIADLFEALQAAHPGVEMGSYPFWRQNRLGTALVLRGDDDGALQRAAAALDRALGAAGIAVDQGERGA